MELKSLESLVLGGIRVEGGVKTNLMRKGSKQAHVQTSASLSHPRHLSQRRPMSPSWPMADYQADSRRDTRVLTQPGSPDADAAIRAGRSVSSASVPVSCSKRAAHVVSGTLGRTIRMRWSLAEGGPCSTAVRRFGCLATTRTSAANEPLAHPRFSRIEADGMKQMPLKKQAFGKTKLAWPMPAGAFGSTRGA
jgi:hypothetical protein